MSCCCCGKSSFVLPKLQGFGDQERTDALLLFSNVFHTPSDNDNNIFEQTCRHLAELHGKNPRSVEMLIPQLCGACSKLRPCDVDTLETHFFVSCSTLSFHFAMLCSLSLLGMVLDAQPHPRRSSQNLETLSAASAAESVPQQRLMRLLHRICCAAVARSRGLTDSHGFKTLRDDRHFLSESSFAALVLCKDGSNGYGGLNFLDSIRQELERRVQSSDGHDGGHEMGALAGGWRAPPWMTKAMLQRLRVMCDTFWLMSQCVGFSEDLRGVADRPSRRSRLTSLLQSINSLLPQRSAYVPIAFSDATFAIVTRIPETDAHVFSTKARVPYLAAFVQEPQPKFCSDPFSQGMRGALQGAGMILSDAANSARAKVSNAADRLEDFVRSNRSQTQTQGSMTEGLLSLQAVDSDQQLQVQELSTRQKKSASAPGVFIPNSLSQLEDAVASPANAELLSTLEVDVTVVDGDRDDADDAVREASALHLPEITGEQTVQLVIFKSNDDLRQEMFAMLLIHVIRTAWLNDGLELYLREYRVLSTSPSSGLVEVVPDSSSIDSLKKSNGCLSLARHFDNSFGAGSAARERAVSAYISSLAGYSLLSYLLNIKDRHNGNILLQRDGHIVHIDFGFFFSIAPGGITFESAPFKLTRDFHELVGPNVMTNPRYAKLVEMMTQGLISVRKHVARILTLVQRTFDIVGSGYPCFKLGQRAVDELHASLLHQNLHASIATAKTCCVQQSAAKGLFDAHDRFLMEQPDAAMQQSVQGLLSQAWGNQRSSIYDYFQYKTNGILY